MTDGEPKRDQRSEEEIVEEIYASKEPVEFHESLGCDGFLLKYGGKELKLVFEKKNLTVADYIENADETKRTERETTLIFKAAKKIIQDWSDEVGKRIVYRPTTQNENLKAWLLDPEKGQAIFAWDSVKEYGDDEKAGMRGRVTLTKAFYSSKILPAN